MGATEILNSITKLAVATFAGILIIGGIIQGLETRQVGMTSLENLILYSQGTSGSSDNEEVIVQIPILRNEEISIDDETIRVKRGNLEFSEEVVGGGFQVRQRASDIIIEEIETS